MPGVEKLDLIIKVSSLCARIKYVGTPGTGIHHTHRFIHEKS